jgi:hypothetical protein
LNYHLSSSSSSSLSLSSTSQPPKLKLTHSTTTIATMHYTAATAILAFASAAVAAPQLDKPIYPPWTQSTNFRLVANVTGADLVPSIQDYVLASYHVGAGQGAAILVPNDATNPGRQFYVNGTAEDIRYNRGTIQSSGGAAPVCPPPQNKIPRQ